jgi:hypothetical protein
MPTQIRLIPQQIADLAGIRKLGAERVRSVVEHLRGLEVTPLRPEALQEDFATALGGDTRAAECLLRPILALSQLLRQRELSVGEVLDGLRFAVATADPAWSDDEVAAWNAVEPHFAELFRAKSVRTVSKALDLAYEHANLFQSARIVTDIRPIFNDVDDEQMEIDAAVVAFTLRLHYDNREGNHSLSVALDEADVRMLKYQCERALHKAELARGRMQDMAGVPTIISGEAHDESGD